MLQFRLRTQLNNYSEMLQFRLRTQLKGQSSPSSRYLSQRTGFIVVENVQMSIPIGCALRFTSVSVSTFFVSNLDPSGRSHVGSASKWVTWCFMPQSTITFISRRCSVFTTEEHNNEKKGEGEEKEEGSWHILVLLSHMQALFVTSLILTAGHKMAQNGSTHGRVFMSFKRQFFNKQNQKWKIVVCFRGSRDVIERCSRLYSIGDITPDGPLEL